MRGQHSYNDEFRDMAFSELMDEVDADFETLNVIRSGRQPRHAKPQKNLHQRAVERRKKRKRGGKK